jgi:hypothetical protein
MQCCNPSRTSKSPCTQHAHHISCFVALPWHVVCISQFAWEDILHAVKCPMGPGAELVEVAWFTLCRVFVFLLSLWQWLRIGIGRINKWVKTQCESANWTSWCGVGTSGMGTSWMCRHFNKSARQCSSVRTAQGQMMMDRQAGMTVKWQYFILAHTVPFILRKTVCHVNKNWDTSEGEYEDRTCDYKTNNDRTW